MGDPIDNPQAWEEFNDQLPGLLDHLLASEIPLGPTIARRRMNAASTCFPMATRTCTWGARRFTARARAADRLEARSFAQRYSEHINAGSQPGTAPLAARIARERARAEGYDSLPAGDVWWSQRKLPIEKRAPAAHALIGYFAAAKSEICTMQLRVLSLHDDDRGVRSTLVELYVHAQLGTPYNDFSTS